MSQEILSAYTAAAKNSGTDMSVVWERLLTQFQSRGATMADFAGAVASTDLAGPDLLAALQEIADRFGSTIPDVAPEVVSQAFMDGGRQYADSVQQRIEDAMGRTIQLAREEGDETNNAYTG
ncbi:MAG: hypothetical protein EBZ69_03440 [Alphaproteobacteria bacterium]|nr:hypothetical protein [Alphaproteobacteria bacterium]NDC55854.1 hypothetical protein [Alphaproteobacteria bacterium]NDG04138.1 hypothetical protein [Alphaproteobacteria bacterium]